MNFDGKPWKLVPKIQTCLVWGQCKKENVIFLVINFYWYKLCENWWSANRNLIFIQSTVQIQTNRFELAKINTIYSEKKQNKQKRRRDYINIPQFPHRNVWNTPPSISIYHSHELCETGTAGPSITDSLLCTREPIGNSISDMIRSAKRLLKYDNSAYRYTHINDLHSSW